MLKRKPTRKKKKKKKRKKEKRLSKFSSSINSTKASRVVKKRGAFVLCILDPFLNYNFKKDTSHLLLLELSRRGYSIYYSTPSSLASNNGDLKVHTNRVTVVESEPYFIFGKEEILPVHQFCLVLMRKDPPVDQSYLHTTQLLSQVTAKTLVINDPHSLANLNEKLILSYFPTWAPPTLVTSNPAEIQLFLKTHRGAAILKSLSSFAGRDVEKIKENDPETAFLVDKMTGGGRRPVMVQAYLSEVEKGEKRIFMIDGNPLGALLRVPPRGGFITNPDLGGYIKATGLTKKEKELCATLSPFLKKNKIFFAGVDVIAEKLIEINITSPGFLWEFNEVDHKNYERDIVDHLEGRLS